MGMSKSKHVSRDDTLEGLFADRSMVGTVEVAQFFGVNPSTLRAWEASKKIRSPQRTPGGIRRYSRADVEAILAQFTTSSSEATGSKGVA